MIDRITLVKGDITKMDDVDAIVSAIPVTLKLQSSLNEALIRAAGPELDDAILEHVFRPKQGDVFVLPGLRLPVKHLMLAIMPPWRDGSFDKQDRDLIVCYRHPVEAARRMKFKKIAFPAIATGRRHGYPLDRAARLALTGILERLGDPLEEVRIVCNRDDVYDAFVTRLAKMKAAA
jgi:O-acetyl-ADP-ribose deacetylase (regulator of RNase III)